MKNIEQALRVFCEEESYRNLNHIISQGEYIFSSDGFVLARVKKKDIEDFSFAIEKDRPKLFPITICIDNKEYSIDDFRKIIDGVEKVHETEIKEKQDDCRYCDGDGNIYYKGHRYDCPVCEGSGIEESAFEVESDNLIIPSNALESLNDIAVRVVSLEKIVNFMEIMNITKAYVHKHKIFGYTKGYDSIAISFDIPVEILVITKL